MAKINHEPIQTVLKAFNKLYPNDRTPIVFIDSRNPKNKKLFYNKNVILDFLFKIPFINKLEFINYGYSKKRIAWGGYDSKNYVIYIDAMATIVGSVDILAHELAHAVTYKDNKKEPHGQAWRNAYKFIYDKFVKTAKMEIDRSA